MFPLTPDQKQQISIERRRKVEDERKKRIFDEKQRTKGLDLDALDEQVNSKKVG